MKRVVILPALLMFLFLTMVFVGCSTDIENPAGSSDKKDVVQLTEEQQALLASIPTNLTQDEMVAKLAEVFPGQFVPAEQKPLVQNVNLAPANSDGEPAGRYLTTIWSINGFVYTRVYDFHFDWAGPLQEPGGASHMNYVTYSTNKKFVNRDGGGKVTKIANLHVSVLKTRPNCLYIYDTQSKKGVTKCVDGQSRWDKVKQIETQVQNFLVGIGIAMWLALSATVIWLLANSKYLLL